MTGYQATQEDGAIGKAWAARITPRMHEFLCPDPKKGLLGKSGSHTVVCYDWHPAEGQNVRGTVLCVHGLTRNGHDFDYFAAALAEKGFRVLCPDVAGRGRSGWFENSKNYNYPAYCADMLYVLDRLSIAKVDWVGTSMGGLMGMMVAASHPDRVKRLVINDIGPFIPKSGLRRIGSTIGQRVLFQSMQDGEDYLRRIMITFGIRREDHWRHIAQFNFQREPGGGLRIAYDPALAETFWHKGKQRKLPDMDFWKLWEKVTCPVLVLRGMESDILLTDTAERMARREGVKLVEFPGIGHAPMLMEDEQIAPVAEWLKN